MLAILLISSTLIDSQEILIYSRLQPIGLNPSKKKYANADKSGSDGVTLEMLHKLGATLLFGRTRDLEVWSVRLKQEDAKLQILVLIDDSGGEPVLNDNSMDNLVLPFVFHQNEKVIPVNDGIKLKRNDRVTFLINLRREKEADDWFERNGWGIATL